MAINKNAYIRYQILDECLSNHGRQYYIMDLLEAVNEKLRDIRTDMQIKKRQLYDDIKFMESSEGFSADIEKYGVGRRKYYRYRDRDFSIKNGPINPAEAEYMRSAIQVLSRFSGTPQFEWVEELLPMLEIKFGKVKEKRQIISYESNVDYKGAKYIQPLFNAIYNKRVLSMCYKPFGQGEEIHFNFHPYYLKQFNNRWFVIGLNEGENNTSWTVPLDRIVSFEEIDKTYIPTDNDWDDYFYDIVGVTRHEGNPEEVKLLFREGGNYIETKPLHPTQKTRDKAEGLEVRINVVPNFELKKLILSFGDQVEVLAPSSLRAEIKAVLLKTVSRY